MVGEARTVNELLLNIAYSLMGFGVGFFTGRLSRDVHDIKEAVVPNTFAKSDEDDAVHPTALGIVVIVLSVLTVATSAYATFQTWEQADCTRDYNARFAVAFQARAKTNDADRTALNNMLVGIADQRLTRAERTRIYNDYVAQVKRSNETRKKNPLPQPPDPADYCAR